MGSNTRAENPIPSALAPNKKLKHKQSHQKTGIFYHKVSKINPFCLISLPRDELVGDQAGHWRDQRSKSSKVGGNGLQNYNRNDQLPFGFLPDHAQDNKCEGNKGNKRHIICDQHTGEKAKQDRIRTNCQALLTLLKSVWAKYWNAPLFCSPAMTPIRQNRIASVRKSIQPRYCVGLQRNTT